MTLDKLNIQTSHNVTISHKTAGIGNRLPAFLLDALFMVSYAALVGLFISLLNIKTSTALLLIIYSPLMVYNLFFETVFNGQSPGKMIMNIKVVKLSGNQAGFVDYFLRWVFRLVDIALVTGAPAILSIILSKNSQRLGDMAAGTTVVKLNKKHLKNSLLFAETKEDREIVFPEVKQLSDKDISIVEKVAAKYRKDNYNNNNILLAYKTKDKIEKKLGIQSELKPLAFFETIIKDYISVH